MSLPRTHVGVALDRRRRAGTVARAVAVCALLAITARPGLSTVVQGRVSKTEATMTCAYALRFCPGSCGGVTTSGYGAQADLDPGEEVRDLHFKVTDGSSLPPIAVGNYANLKVKVHRQCVVDPDSDPNTANSVERDGPETDVTDGWNGPQWASGAQEKEMVLTAKDGHGIGADAGTAPTVAAGATVTCCCVVVTVSWDQPEKFTTASGKVKSVGTGDLFVIATNNASLASIKVQGNNGAISPSDGGAVTAGQRRQGASGGALPKLRKSPGPVVKTQAILAWSEGQTFLAPATSVTLHLASGTDRGFGWAVVAARALSEDRDTDPLGIGIDTAQAIPPSYGLAFTATDGVFDADGEADVTLVRAGGGAIPAGVREIHVVLVVKDADGAPLGWSTPVSIPLQPPD